MFIATDKFDSVLEYLGGKIAQSSAKKPLTPLSASKSNCISQVEPFSVLRCRLLLLVEAFSGQYRVSIVDLPGRAA